MNPLLKNLAEQAGISIRGHYDESGSTPAELGKFAELLVKEFAQLVEDNIDPQNAWITPGYIKQHFGVE